MKIYFKFIFIVLFLACLNESGFAQSSVNIRGKLLSDQDGGVITIDNNMSHFAPAKAEANSIVDKSGNFIFNFKIPKPMVLQLFTTKFYFTPGDSVFVNVTGSRYLPEKLEFKGRNANNYNYTIKYDSLKRSLRFIFVHYDFKNGLEGYRDSLNVNKTILLNFLNGYSNSHNLTADFKVYALSQIAYEYDIQLLYPFTVKKLTIEQVPSFYSDILEQIKLNDNNLVERDEYANTAKLLLNYHLPKYKGNELQFINNNFKELTKELLLTYYAQNLISNYVSKDSLITKELFEKIDSGINSSLYKEYFIPIKKQHNKLLNALPKEVVQTVLIDSIGHKLTLMDLMAKSKNKIIVLDFWASWCGACIQEMPKVNKIKKNFSNSDVEFVFISLDKTEALWRGGLAKTKIPGNHYWIKENFSSALVKDLTITAIPRYVIINKSGKFESLNAGGPVAVENGLNAQLSKLLN